MRTSYSIIFASLRKVTQEKVSLGLILSDNETVLCKLSHQKIAALKHLVNKVEFKIINDSIKALRVQLEAAPGRTISHTHDLIRLPIANFTSDYITYLSRYKNNLIAYSEPKYIDLPANEEYH